jgi:hypothetical protein
MKKILLSMMAAGALLSCDNESAVNPLPLGTVTIKGTVLSNLSAENDYDQDFTFTGVIQETIPAGVIIYFFDDETNALLGQTLTDTNGSFSGEVEIGVAARDIRIEIGDFQTTLRLINNTRDGFDSFIYTYTERASVVVSGAVKGGQYIRIIDLDAILVTDDRGL